MSHRQLCASLHLSCYSGDLASFARPRDLLAPLHDALFAETNPVPLKAALAMLNLATSDVRLPLIRATEPTKDRLEDILAQVMSREEWVASHPRYALGELNSRGWMATDPGSATSWRWRRAAQLSCTTRPKRRDRFPPTVCRRCRVAQPVKRRDQ
jgi:hypothetical protein